VRAIFIKLETDNKETAGNSEDMLLQTKAWHHQGRFLETCHRPDLGAMLLSSEACARDLH
jgi:hypothetical protein